MRLAAVLGLEGHAGGSDAGLQGPLGAKGAKKGRAAVTGRVLASWGAFTLCLHTSQPKALF